MKFDTPYRVQKRFFVSIGSRTKPEYRPHINRDGELELEVVGKIDTYAEIQSHAISVDIHHLIDQYRLTGDTSIFNRVQAVYGDVSGIPTNYADILNLRLKMETEFASLPAEMRSKFDNDINKYVAQYGSAVWAENLGLSNKSDNKPIKESEESAT